MRRGSTSQTHANTCRHAVHLKGVNYAKPSRRFQGLLRACEAHRVKIIIKSLLEKYNYTDIRKPNQPNSMCMCTCVDVYQCPPTHTYTHVHTHTHTHAPLHNKIRPPESSTVGPQHTFTDPITGQRSYDRPILPQYSAGPPPTRSPHPILPSCPSFTHPSLFTPSLLSWHLSLGFL